MTASDEFKEKLKAGEIFDAFNLAISEAIELEITTWVSSSDSDNQSSGNANQPKPGYCMRTRMNLVDGKIENEVGSQFIGNGPYTELMQFHLEQVKEGRQIVLKNLESLQKMFVVLTSTLSQLPQTSSRRLEQEKPALSPSNQDNLIL